MSAVAKPANEPRSSSELAQFGQGKSATTILASQGDVVHVVSDVPYKVRSKHAPAPCYRGARPMHRSTLTLRGQPGSYETSTGQCVSRISNLSELS